MKLKRTFRHFGIGGIFLCVAIPCVSYSEAHASNLPRTYIHIGADPVNPRLCEGVAGSKRINPNEYRARVINDLHVTTVGKSGKKTHGYILGETAPGKNDGTEVLVKKGIIVAICICGNPILNEKLIADNRSVDPVTKQEELPPTQDLLERMHKDPPPSRVQPVVLAQKQPDELPCIGKGTVEVTAGGLAMGYGIKLLFIPTPVTWAFGGLLTVAGATISWIGANENDSKPVCKFIGGIVGGVGGSFIPGPSINSSSAPQNGGPAPQPTNGPTPGPGGPSPSPMN